jgi:phospholipase/carboxylesterase
MEDGHETGRAWYFIDALGIRQRIENGAPPYPLQDEVPPGMVDALGKLHQCVDALVSDHAVDPSRLVVGGFSQGAVMATDFALHRRPLVAGLAVLSGRLLSPERMAAPLREIGSRLRVLQTHGVSDPVIPLRNGEALRAVLENQGAEVEWHPYSGGHAITTDVRDALGAFCRQAFASISTSPSRILAPTT